MRALAVHRVLASEAQSRHQGGVVGSPPSTMTPHTFQVGFYQPHSPTVTTSQVAAGGHRWFIFGYIVTDDVSTIMIIVVAFFKCPCGTALITFVNFNANITETAGNHREDEILTMITAGLEVMANHFHAQASKVGEVPAGLYEMVGAGGY